MAMVRFATDEDAERGYSFLLHNGTVIYTSERNSFIVPEESIEKLTEALVNFEVLPISKNGQ